MTIRFALLGAGRIGKVHAKAITANPGARLVAVADAMPKAAEDIAAQYGCEVRTIDAIATARDIDAVVICTPTDTHADLIEKFSHAGKAIFCEKPIDLSVKRVQDCLKVVAANRTPLMVGSSGCRLPSPFTSRNTLPLMPARSSEGPLASATCRRPGSYSTDPCTY